MGVPAPSSPSGCQPAASAVPASQSGIPNAGMLPNITYLSCPLCHGTRQTQFGACSSCADPDPAVARFMLERLTAEQIDYLRAYKHTLAKQPVSEYPNDCELFVEADDGIWDDESDEQWLIPPSRHWFGSGEMSFGPGGNVSFVRYNPMGLLLRKCLMCGPGAGLPSMYPPRSASGIEAATADETRSGSAEGESPTGKAGDAQPSPSFSTPITDHGKD